MDSRFGLTVVYTDSDGAINPAHICSAVDGSGMADLVVFVSEIRGFRLDQTAVPYSATAASNTWSNV
jgi:hypothetical protein